MGNPDAIEDKSTHKIKMSPKKARNLTFAFSLLAVLLLISSAVIGLNAAPEEITTFSMGSYVQQKVYGGDKQNAARAAAAAIAELENTISWRVEGSDIEKLALNAGGDYLAVKPVTYALLKLCKDVAELSGGAFDVTIAPISHLWDFDRGDEFVPEQSLIDELLPHVNYENILLGENDTAALKDKLTSIDLGGIGKGAACDAAISIYEQSSVGGGIIAVGGSVGVYGGKLFGDAWNIAIRDPASTGTMAELKIREGFVSTSGNYEKAFTKDNVLYHHILDPKTGYPADSGLVSVTVKASSGALSDALSTASFILGLDEAKELLKKYDAEGIFIDNNRKVYVTEGIEAKDFKITENTYSLAENK